MNTSSPTIAKREVSITIALGEVEPHTCQVDQPHGVCAGELLAEEQARLALLLTQQEKYLPDFIRETFTPEAIQEALTREITNCLAAIQRLAATPTNRCIA